MLVRIWGQSSTDPTVFDVAPVTSHVVAASGFVDRRFARGTARHARVNVVKKNASLARDLACRLVVGVSALEARCEVAGAANGASLAATAWPCDNCFATWSRTPLQLARLADAHIFLDHLVLLLDLG